MYGEPDADSPPVTTHDAEPPTTGRTLPDVHPTGVPVPLGLMVKVAVPEEGAGRGGALVTCAVNVTVRPATDGFADDETVVVVDDAEVTVKLTDEYEACV